MPEPTPEPGGLEEKIDLLLRDSKLPPVPPLNASLEEISHYRELTDIAYDNVTKLIETVVAKVLFPLLMLVVGIAVGRKVSLKSDD